MKQTFAILTVMLGFSLAHAGSAKAKQQDIQLQVTEKGFEPKEINVKPGTEVTLKVTRKTDNTCAGSIVIADKNIERELPLNKQVSIQLGKLNAGEIRFAYGMKMIKGVILIR